MDILEIIKKFQEMYGDDVITTADKIKIPDPKPIVKEIELVNEFMKRNPKADGGQLVAPSVDGSRPGYANDRKDVIEKAKKRAQAREKGLIYDMATKTFRKKEGVTYLTTTKKNKIKKAFPNVKLNFKLYPTTGVKKYLTKDQNKTNKTWAAINRFKNKGYTLEDLRTGGSGQLPPIEKGKISATELLEVINKASGTTYTPGYLTDPRPGKKAFLQNIIADTLNRELRTQVRTTKRYGKTKGPRTYYVFDKPTAAQLDFFVQYIDAPFLYDKTVRNVKILDKEIGKELAKSTKKDAVDYFTNNLTIDKVKQILKDNGVKNPTNYKAANAMTRYGQALQGKLFKNLDGITKNTKTGDFVFKAFNEIDRYHPWSQGAYTAILNDIDSRMGKQAGNLSQFKNAFKAKMKVLYPGRKFDFNEVFSLSTSANRGSYPYAYFVDLTSSAMNRGALSAYQGAASVAEGRIQTAIKNFRRTGNQKFYKKAVDIANVFNNQTRKNFLSSEKVLEYQKNYGIKPNALKIEIGSQRQVADKINIASNYFSDRNLQKWKNLGIDIDAHSGRAGYVKTFGRKGVPKNVITAGELFTEDTRLGKSKKIFDGKAITNFSKNNLIALCEKSKGKLGQASGGRIGYQDAGAVGKTLQCGINQFNKNMKTGNANGALMRRILANGGNILTSIGKQLNPAELLKLRNLIGPQALGFFAAYEAGVITDDVLRKGIPLNESVAKNWLTKSFVPFSEEFARQKNLLKSGTLNENQRIYALDMMKAEKAFKEMDRIEGMERDQLIEGTMDDDFIFNSQEKIDAAKTNVNRIVEDLDSRDSFRNTGKQMENIRAMDEMEASRMAKKRYSPFFGKLGTPLVNKLAKPARTRGGRGAKREIKIDFSLPTYDRMETPTDQDILNAYRQHGVISPTEFKTGVLQPGEGTLMRMMQGGQGLYGTQFATGGMVGDKSGPPPTGGPMSQGLRSLYNNGRKL